MGGGVESTRLFMQEGHREAASLPSSVSLCGRVFIASERTNATM